MDEELVNSGIDVVGIISWGTHICQFYETKEDLLDILIPYFEAGLRNNEFCMWITSEPLNAEDALAAAQKQIPGFSGYLENGQIEILPHTEWYYREGVFDAQRIFKDLVEKHTYALSMGYKGLRLTGNTFWLTEKLFENFIDYERAVQGEIGKYKMIAVCTYNLATCGANEIINVLSSHQYTMSRRNGQWTLIESSERKLADMALHREKGRLEILVQERTSELEMAIKAVQLEVANHMDTENKLKKVFDGVIETISAMGEMRDPYTAGHGKRTATLAASIAAEMRLTQEQIECVRISAYLHDIGKIVVPSEILAKPCQLSTNEWGIMKHHPRIGYEILNKIDFPWPIGAIVFQHHERLDGTGYPLGLKGEQIILDARIVAIADVIEAMVSHRPWRPALKIGDALSEITQKKGVYYDPNVADACLSLFTERGFRFNA